MIEDVVILGASGRIGSAMQRHAQSMGHSVKIIDRETYLGWDDENQARATLTDVNVGKTSLLVCAAGVINPKADEALIKKANLDVPLTACSAARALGAKAVSLGTVLETILPNESQNAYVASKSKLKDHAENNWLHLQLHTVYGGSAPTPFMFTGLMFNALLRNKRFSMTSGEQLREYHHVDDEVAAILHLARESDTGTMDLSHGNAIKLCDLASDVFDRFGKLDLLGVGDITSPTVEAYEPVFSRNNQLENKQFRDAIPAVYEWLAKSLDHVEKS